MASGRAASDLPIHTLHSFDVIPTRATDPLRLCLEARRLERTFVAFTNHDTMDAYDRTGWTRDGLMPAVEVKILDQQKVGRGTGRTNRLLGRLLATASRTGIPASPSFRSPRGLADRVSGFLNAAGAAA